MSKKFEELRPFDLEAAKAGAPDLLHGRRHPKFVVYP